MGGGTTLNLVGERMATISIDPKMSALKSAEVFPLVGGLRMDIKRPGDRVAAWRSSDEIFLLEYGKNLMKSCSKGVAVYILYLIIVMVWGESGIMGNCCESVRRDQEWKKDKGDKRKEREYWEHAGKTWCRSAKFMGWSTMQVFMFLVRSGQVEIKPGPNVHRRPSPTQKTGTAQVE